MTTLLHLDSSANPGSSVSRILTAEFAKAWQTAQPVSTVIHRDLSVHPAALLDREGLAALWSKPGAELTPEATRALGGSDALTREFLAADAFVMGVPMYNFSVPASFKAWLDQVIRAGRTMMRGPAGLEAVIKGRKALVISTRAGDYSRGGSREGWDFVEPYLRTILPYAGLEVTFVPVMVSPRDGEEGQVRRMEEARGLLRRTLELWMA